MTSRPSTASMLNFWHSIALALVVILSNEIITLACTPLLQALFALSEIDAWSLSRSISVALVLLGCLWIRSNVEIPLPRISEISETRFTSIVWALSFCILFFYGLKLNYELSTEATRQFYQSEISGFREDISKTSVLPLIAVTVADNLAIPVLEEFAFRGLIFLSLARRTNYWVASIVSSLLFAACHPSYFALMLCFGFCLCAIVHRSKSILPAIVMHVAYNSLVTLSILT